MQSYDPDQVLHAILAEPLEQCQAREQTAFDRLSAGFPEIVLYGAGNLGRKTLAGLRAEGVEPLGFTDGNPAIWGGTVHGLPIASPSEAVARWGRDATFVICIWRPGVASDHPKIEQMLRELGARSVTSFIPLFWKYGERFLPHFRLDYPHKIIAAADQVKAAYALMADDHSRAEFARQLQLLSAASYLQQPGEVPYSEMYFAPGIISLSPHGHLVDCGAYDGDTLRAFLSAVNGRFHKIDAFEPDPINFKSLTGYVESLEESVWERISLHPFAVGDQKTTLLIDSTGTESSVISALGTTKIECVRLDDVIVGSPTIIKMDIEGFEPAALIGASRLIESHNPCLAICAYHEQDHLWRLPLLIQSLNSGYNYHLRRYGIEYWDLVLYAVPK